ncbi:unnamed protein product [Dovyalis caffra]|uniref:Uncharacterized protein n=1 Tax=Dovyalis caffra TaxID=77055 RepID=A0AAV1RST7_9ROSI|nr:unnamed protein product [Dovyalis caffra]
MSTGAAEVILQRIFTGSISLDDMEIRRRPYHRNCKCALHKLKDICSDACPQQRNISFTKKQVRSDHSLSKATSRLSSPSSTADSNDKVGVSSRKLGIRNTSERIIPKTQPEGWNFWSISTGTSQALS